MKVLYLLRYFPTATETFVYNEINGMLELGVDVEIATLGRREDGIVQDDLPNCPVHFIPRAATRYLRPICSHGQRWLQNHQRRKDVQRLPELIKLATGFDHIHVHFAGEAAEFAHALWLDCATPYSVTTHAVDLFCPRPSLLRVLEDAERVITISNYNQRYLASLGITSTVIRCGIDLGKWTPSPLPQGPLRGIFVGRNVPKKGLSLLLGAATTLRKNQLITVITDNPPPAQKNLRTLPLQSAARVRQLIQEHNLLIAPCRIAKNGDRDGIPVILLEALAAGRPILSTNLSGIPELVTPEVGKLIPPDCVGSLTNSLHSITNSCRNSWASETQNRIKSYGVNHLEQAQHLHRLLENRRQSCQTTFSTS